MYDLQILNEKILMIKIQFRMNSKINCYLAQNFKI